MSMRTAAQRLVYSARHERLPALLVRVPLIYDGINDTCHQQRQLASDNTR
jgi:hypothetical protein